jgi:hypothetical protein
VMIRDMYLLDAEATVVQDPTTNEQRMITKSKCGSKSVTTIRKYPVPCSSAIVLFCRLTTVVPPTSSDAPINNLQHASNLRTFFVNIGTEETTIFEQSLGNFSTFALLQAED